MAHIIAEAGTNHNGSVETGKALASAAHEAGAHSVKFQFLFAEGLYLPVTWNGGEAGPNDVVQKRKQTELSDAQWREIAAHCASLGLPVSASVFDDRSVNLLRELEPPYAKVASCDCNNYGFLRKVGEAFDRVVLSTGMASIQEIDTAVETLLSESDCEVVLLHCVSRYPTPLSGTELGAIPMLRERYGITVGYSDHTESSTAACVAAALGATWFEKHVTLDRSSLGFDHVYAAEPETFESYVRELTDVVASLASGLETEDPAEAEVRTRARRGLWAARSLEVGEVVGPDDVLVVRPEASMAPGDLPLVIGATVVRKIHRYEEFTVDSIAPDVAGTDR